MEKFIQIIIELLLIASSFLHSSYSTKLGGCHIDDNYVAICTSIPECNDLSLKYFKQVRKFVFYNQLSKIESRAFSNCKFSNQLDTIELIFNSLTEIEDFSFSSMNIDSNTKVNLIINGEINTKELLIHQNAFKELNLSRNSILFVEISNYKQVKIEGTLFEDVVQDENSIVNFVFKKNNQILFSSSPQTSPTPSQLTKNITFKLEISNSKRVFIDEEKFKFLTIDALSEFLFIISDTNEVIVGRNAFSSLTISYKAKFSIFIKKSNNVLIGEGLFQNLIQEDYSLFFLIIQNLENPDEDDNLCLCIPQDFMKNIKQNRYALLQVHFIDFKSHYISFSQKALSELFLNDNSKVQFYFKDIDYDIIFQNETINYLQLTNGIFEIIVENHASRLYSSDLTPVSFVLDLNAIKKVYLTSRSTFKIGFHNSSSIFNLNEASISGVHLDNFVDEQPDYRTKVNIEVKNSPNFRIKFSKTIDSKLKIPLLIEIDDYMPLLSMVNLDGTFDVSKTLNAKTYNRKYEGNQNSLLQYELCQYSRLQGYLENNMVFFSEPLMLKNNQLCSSCLFLYLYRYVHRRQDFYYRRDQLPDCFTNLFYRDLFEFNEQAYKKIDDKINKYWSLQRCGIITGMRSINDSKSEMLLEKNICSQYFIDTTYRSALKCNSVDFKQIKNKIIFKVEENNEDLNIKQSSFSNILTLIIVAIIGITCFVIIVNTFVKRNYCKKPCIHVNLRKKNNFKFFKLLTSVSDQPYANECEDDDENENDNKNEICYDKRAGCSSNENLKLCKLKTGTNSVKKFIQNKTKSIFNRTEARKNNYQTMKENNEDLGKYEKLDQTDENMNACKSTRIKKSAVSVLYNVSKNKTTLSKSDDNCDEQEEYQNFDDSIGLKTNPMHYIDVKNKPVAV